MSARGSARKRLTQATTCRVEGRIIPFGFASFYPTVRLLGRSEFHELAPLGPVVAAAFLALALFVWNRGVRQYSSTGS